jgi:TP901 family phage tail tape measure protein
MADFEKVYKITFDTKAAERSLKKMDDAIEQIGKEAKRAGDKIRKHIGKDAVASMKRLNSVTKKTRLSLQKTGAAIEGIGRKLSLVSAGFAAFGGLSIKSALDLNKSMANVSTLLSGSTEQTVRLKESVQDLSVETGKSATDLADGLYDVVSALGENVQNAEQLGVSAKASVAGLSTTKEAVGLLTATTKGYGDTSVDAMKKVSDLAFQTVKLGVTTFPELSESMGRVIPLAAAMNTSQEELFGTMATLTGVTGNAAEVSTQLSSIYSAFLKPSKALTDVAKQYGFETAGAMLKARGFRQSLLDVNKAADGNEGKLAKMLKRKEALVAALALLGGQSDTYKDKLDQMANAAGATDEAYRKQTEGINKQGHEWAKTRRRMEKFMVRLGDKLLPVLDRLLDAIEPIIVALEKMTDAQMESAVQWGLFVVALGPVLTGLGKILVVAGKIKAALAAIGAVAGASAATVGVAIAGVVAAIAGAYAFFTTLTNGVEMVFSGFEAAFWAIVNTVQTGLNKLIELAQKIPVVGSQLGLIDTSGSATARDAAAANVAARASGLGAAVSADKMRVLGSETEAVQRQRSGIASLQAQVNQQSNIAKYGGGGGEFSGDEWAVQSQAAASGGGGGGVSNNVNINVNSASDNPRAVARAVKAEFDKETKKLDAGSRSITAGEQ